MSARTHSKPRLERLEARETPSLTPIGSEFRVNDFSTGIQRFSDVKMDANGDFVVTWDGYDPNLFPTTGYGIHARRFAPDGTPMGNEIAVADSGGLSVTKVAVAPNGQFVVIWDNRGLGSHVWVYARVYSADDQPMTPAIRVHQSTSYEIGEPNVAIESDGDFAVSWQRLIDLNSASYVAEARRFSAAGNPTCDDIALGSTVYDGASGPTVAVREDHTFYVAWNYPNGAAIERFDSSGQALTGIITIDQAGTKDPVAVADTSGDLVLAYSKSGTNYLRTYDSNGQPLTSPMSVSTAYLPSAVGVSTNGDIIVSWLGPQSIQARSYMADGTPNSPVVQVNTASANGTNPWCSSIGIAPDGSAVICWYGLPQGTNSPTSWDVFAQRFLGPNPAPRQPLYNGGSASRSTVNSITTSFNRTLALPTNAGDAFVLTGPGGATIPVAVDTSGSTPAGTVARLTFPSYPNSLPNGRYTLRMLASQIHDTAGQAFDGNGDGTPGDDAVFTFFRLAGDFNGDGVVNAVDFIALRTAFGTYNQTFDLNNDGIVNAADFLLFRFAFGTSV